MKNQMVDVLDYTSRLFSAVFLCPVAASSWVLFALSGFSLTGLFIKLGGYGQYIALMDPEEFGVFMFQFLGGWASLAFLFLLISFAFKPPKFNYVLKRRGQRQEVSISQ
jgi:hypothetical protein